MCYRIGHGFSHGREIVFRDISPAYLAGWKDRKYAHIAGKKSDGRVNQGGRRTGQILPEHQRRLAAMGALPGPAVDDTPAPAPVISLDAEKLAREAERRNRETREAEQAAFEMQLEELDDASRYERLLERRYQGRPVSKRWESWMAYYEETPEYARDRELWDNRRSAYTMMYQVEEG